MHAHSGQVKLLLEPSQLLKQRFELWVALQELQVVALPRAHWRQLLVLAVITHDIRDFKVDNRLVWFYGARLFLGLGNERGWCWGIWSSWHEQLV